jgi:UDP-N-acetylglucosamine 1-carboxyvinyltransferase
VDRIFVHGGNPLQGSIRVSGSKNASLAIMAAALLVEGKTTFHNVPRIRDIFAMAEMLRVVGATVTFSAETVEIDATGFRETCAPEELVRQMRASFYVLGPMLARLGAARLAQPGGCDIGARPVDFHVKGMQALGARLRTEGGIVEGFAEGLRGAKIYLDFPSAGATTHLMTAACLAEGTTTLENAAAEPEVVDVANFLNSLGGRVTGAGTSTVVVEGVKRLRANTHYEIIPDRMEAGTFMCAAAITRGDVILENVVAAHLQPVVIKLRDMGVKVCTIGADDDQPGMIRVTAADRCHAVDILAMPHPGFPTDMQQPMVALLSLCDGAAMVTDRVFENRFRYVGELQRMGADIRVEGRTAFVHGVDRLVGCHVTATDLRAGAALIVAALAAEGETMISGVEHLDRGYDSVVEKLQQCGAEITRLNQDTAARMLSPV